MPKAVGVVFKFLNDVYWTTSLSGLTLNVGDVVIARTIRAKELGRVIQIRDESPRQDNEPFVRKVLRVATEKDFEREEGNRDREAKAFTIAQKKVEKLTLPMDLIRVHYLFDHSRILFYFKAAGKVDFRQLVRELASVFKARIELRQIGVRDEAKMLGGVATCGRILCCTSWLRTFAPVTVRMAKDQHLSLNPNKISGLCGRLQCCLEYEQRFYEENLRGVPNMGSLVRTPAGDGKLIKANIFSGQANVLLEDASVAAVPLKDVHKKPRPQQGGRPGPDEQEPRPAPAPTPEGEADELSILDTTEPSTTDALSEPTPATDAQGGGRRESGPRGRDSFRGGRSPRGIGSGSSGRSYRDSPPSPPPPSSSDPYPATAPSSAPPPPAETQPPASHPAPPPAPATGPSSPDASPPPARPGGGGGRRRGRRRGGRGRGPGSPSSGSPSGSSSGSSSPPPSSPPPSSPPPSSPPPSSSS